MASPGRPKGVSRREVAEIVEAHDHASQGVPRPAGPAGVSGALVRAHIGARAVLELRRGRDVGRRDTRHDAVVEAPIDAGDERRGAVDVVAGRGAVPEALPNWSAPRAQILALPKEKPATPFAFALASPEAPPFATRRSCTAPVSTRGASRPRLQALGQILRARREARWAQGQGQIERVRRRRIRRERHAEERDRRVDRGEGAADRRARDEHVLEDGRRRREGEEIALRRDRERAAQGDRVRADRRRLRLRHL